MNCHQTKAARNRHLLVGGQIKIYLCLAIERYVWLACYTVGSNTILKPCKSPKSTTNPYIRMIPALRQGIMADIKLQAQLSLPAESPSCCHTTLPQLSVCACLIWLNKPPYITVHVNKAVPFHWDHQPHFLTGRAASIHWIPFMAMVHWNISCSSHYPHVAPRLPTKILCILEKYIPN